MTDSLARHEYFMSHEDRVVSSDNETTCPWCGRQATEDLVSSCETFGCKCGSFVVGAPSRDFDEVLGEADKFLNCNVRKESCWADALVVRDMIKDGIEIKQGVVTMHDSGLEYTYWWFKKQSPSGGAA